MSDSGAQSRIPRLLLLAILLCGALLLALVAVPGAAFAHGDDDDEEEHMEEKPAPEPRQDGTGAADENRTGDCERNPQGPGCAEQVEQMAPAASEPFDPDDDGGSGVVGLLINLGMLAAIVGIPGLLVWLAVRRRAPPQVA